MKNKQKGTSLMVVFIICTVIGIMLMTTFAVTSNYGLTVVSRKYELRRLVISPNRRLENNVNDESASE